MKIAAKIGNTVAVFYIVSLLISCKSYTTYKIEMQSCEETEGISVDSIESVKIFLETSLSMKGYVNKRNVSDSGYVIKTVVPILITDCRASLCPSELWTISNAPERYSRSEEEFIRNLKSGELMQPGNTQIHLILQHVIESNQPGELSFLISDCIPDLGGGQTLSALEDIPTTLYSVLKSKQSVSAAVFQYYSEFNGDWYYNRNGWERPFNNRFLTLHNRPLYIWIFGEPELIDEALKQGLLSESKVPYQNNFFYRDSFCLEIPYLILPEPHQGQISFDFEENQITIIKISPKIPVSFTIGLNLSNAPMYIKNTEFLSKNLQFDREDLNIGNEIKVYDQNTIKSATDKYKIIAPIITSNSLTHFITITFQNLNLTHDVDFSLVLRNSEPVWIEDVHIQDDLDVPAESLEMKTFASRYISQGFNLRFYSDGMAENTFEIKFKTEKK